MWRFHVERPNEAWNRDSLSQTERERDGSWVSVGENLSVKEAKDDESSEKCLADFTVSSNKRPKRQDLPVSQRRLLIDRITSCIHLKCYWRHTYFSLFFYCMKEVLTFSRSLISPNPVAEVVGGPDANLRGVHLTYIWENKYGNDNDVLKKKADSGSCSRAASLLPL